VSSGNHVGNGSLEISIRDQRTGDDSPLAIAHLPVPHISVAPAQFPTENSEFCHYLASLFTPCENPQPAIARTSSAPLLPTPAHMPRLALVSAVTHALILPLVVCRPSSAPPIPTCQTCHSRRAAPVASPSPDRHHRLITGIPARSHTSAAPHTHLPWLIIPLLRTSPPPVAFQVRVSSRRSAPCRMPVTDSQSHRTIANSRDRGIQSCNHISHVSTSPLSSIR
jgi:hypothetical protein